MQERAVKAAEELQAANDRNNHLIKVKNKLEGALDEMEDQVEREKRGKNEAEKQRRKIECDLRLAQETIDHVERNKKEMEAAVNRKNNEIASLNDKIEQEQALVAKGLKQVKECGVSMVFLFLKVNLKI